MTCKVHNHVCEHVIKCTKKCATKFLSLEPLRFNISTNNALLSITEKYSVIFGYWIVHWRSDYGSLKSFWYSRPQYFAKKNRAIWWCKGEYEINGSGHTSKREHNLFLLEIIHLILGKFSGLSKVNKPQSDGIKKIQVLPCSY